MTIGGAMTFTAHRPHKANWTPGSLIYEWAKANRFESWNTIDGIKVRVRGAVMEYDHLHIDTEGETDRITVYMEPDQLHKE